VLLGGQTTAAEDAAARSFPFGKLRVAARRRPFQCRQTLREAGFDRLKLAFTIRLFLSQLRG